LPSKGIVRTLKADQVNPMLPPGTIPQFQTPLLIRQ
jgi:hypothetical protein